MGILFAADGSKVPRLDFELSTGCDHKCGHCYNVWNASPGDAQAGYPRGQLSTPEFIAMMEKAIRESGAEHVTITGGEPLLRRDALEIIARARSLALSVQLITNGSHVTPEVARRLAEIGLRSVQLTLLSGDRDTHDALKGAVCFDDTVRAAVDLAEAKVPVQVCFVAMEANWRDFESVMELCFALGVRAIAYNRMSATGWAIHHIEQLMPAIEQVEHNLDTAETLGPRWNIHVQTAMPIPPCLIRIERYKWVKLGFCSVGTSTPNITIDPLGNVRSCNLSAHVMGNVREMPWATIHRDRYFHEFRKQLPEMCRGCRYERSCAGGCKESGFATYGDLKHPEPFIHLARAPRKALRVIG
jgi:pyrroloquinoline quinone biosynthesis protein E